MSELLQRVNGKDVAPNSVSAWWLSGSGFILKTHSGAQVLIDPYLSDSVRELFGWGRAVPVPIAPEDVRPDVVICTHWHEDHLDPGTIPIIARNSPDTQFVMPPSAFSRAIGWGVPRAKITPLLWGEKTEIKNIKIEAVFARHDAGIPGWAASDAMGVVLKIGEVKIYHAGDTEHDARLRELKTRNLDAALLCINGVTGNMNAHEAALLAWQIGAKTAIPIHHILWDTNPYEDATLDPNLFVDTYQNLGGKGRVVLPQVGEEIVIGGQT